MNGILGKRIWTFLGSPTLDFRGGVDYEVNLYLAPALSHHHHHYRPKFMIRYLRNNEKKLEGTLWYLFNFAGMAERESHRNVSIPT
jgi:hypothetical protein